jgi:hypothetical protein
MKSGKSALVPIAADGSHQAKRQGRQLNVVVLTVVSLDELLDRTARLGVADRSVGRS